MSVDVRVRCETPMLGLGWWETLTVTRTPLIEAAIAEGRLTVLGDDGEPEAPRGAVLDGALRTAGLPTTGSVADKQARLAAHLAAAGQVDAEADGDVDGD